MAQVKYFKKLSPNTKVVIGREPNLHPIEFTTLNGVVGYYATDQELVQQEFDRAMREQRYGITEITQEEFFRDYVEEKKKAGSPSPKSWREELSRSASHLASDPVGRLGSESAQAALRANGSGDVRQNNAGNLAAASTAMERSAPTSSQPVTMSDTPPASAVPPTQKFVPSVGKRKHRR